VDLLLASLAVVAMLWLTLLLVLWVTGRRAAVRELALLLPNLARLFHGLLRDSRVPARSKILVAIGLAWFASPIDLIPEFIPVIGPLDDAVVGALNELKKDGFYDKLLDQYGVLKIDEPTFSIKGPGPA